MDKTGGELRNVGQVTLLTSTPGGRDTVKGGDKRKMVCEKGERASFKEKAEMAYGKESSEKFSIKSRVTGLGRGKFMGKESKGLPGTEMELLKDGTYVGVGSVRGKR